MSAAESHPEELLDRKRRGTLTAAEQGRLEAHIEACTACAIEMQMREDVAALGRSDDDAVVRRLAAVAIASAGGGPGGGGGSAGPTGGAGGAGSIGSLGGKAWTHALVTAAIGVAALAFIAFGTTDRDAQDAPAPGPDEPTPALSPQQDEPAAAESRLAPVEPPAEHRPAPAAPALPPRAPARASEPAAPEAETTGGLAPEADTTGGLAPEAPTTPTVPSPEVEAASDAASLFRDANAARRSGDYAEAVRLYRELGSRHPGSREEVVSRAILGRLLLDRFDDAPGALLLFRGYLVAAPSGPLAEDALAGRALALGRLGRRSEERAAWTDLLERYPDSVHADRARTRLEAP